MPGASSGFWYWFDYSSIHFVALSSDHNYSRGSEQYKWLGTLGLFFPASKSSLFSYLFYSPIHRGTPV